jgi:Cof subfamily protein (haloacid dehalogenase superfamily)
VSPKLVAIDLDGTLIGPSLEISRADRRAIQDSARDGDVICLASGRLFAAARPFAQSLGLTGPIIVLQGAAAYDVGSGERLFCTPLPSATAIHAYGDLKARGFHMQLYYGDRLYLDELNDRARAYLALSRVEPVVVGNLRELLAHPPPGQPGPIKVLGIAQPEEVSATIPLLGRALAAQANVFRSLPVYLEVTHPDANKGVALRRVAEHLGISMKDTAAIGDSDNDVPMFEAAARSFAVANATEPARRASQHMVAALGSGVAEALRLLQQEGAREPGQTTAATSGDTR